MKSVPTEKSRHFVLRAESGETLPDALVGELRDAKITCGWLRASGVLADIELRIVGADLGAPSAVHRIGHAQLISLDGSIGVVGRELSLGLRAVVARAGAAGVETFAGELVSAQVVALEAVVTAFDDVVATRALDTRAGVWVLGELAEKKLSDAAARAAWGDAVAASKDAAHPPAPKRPAPAAVSNNSASSSAAMPQRITRPGVVSEDTLVPDAGDIVDHFAFGRCDVLKSESDRLHLRIHKDGRVREIALEMLRVTLVPNDDPSAPRHFVLARRM